MGRMAAVTPFVPCKDIHRAFEFYCSMLGFQGHVFDDIHAYVKRDGIALRLVQVSEPEKLDNPERQTSCYIDVAEGLDSLFEELKPQLDTLPEGRVRAPFDQDYGQREFHVIDEDVMLLFFGEPIKS